MESIVLTRDEVAKYLKVSTRTINTLMKKKNLPYYKTGEGKSCKVFFPTKEVDAWIADQARKRAEVAKLLEASDGVRRRVRH